MQIVLDKLSGSMGAGFLGLWFGNLIGRIQFLSAPAVDDKVWFPNPTVLFALSWPRSDASTSSALQGLCMFEQYSLGQPMDLSSFNRSGYL